MYLFREDKQVRCNRVELLFCFLSNIDVAFQILLYFCATIKVMYVGYKNERRTLLLFDFIDMADKYKEETKEKIRK